MKVVVIRYGAGNVQSVLFALQRLGLNPILSSDPREITQADKVVFPGVGEASNTMRELKATGLDEVIINLRQPVLGICLGLQLMCKHSEEGNVNCLGIFNLKVKKFNSAGSMKVPHVGWNNIQNGKGHLFKEIDKKRFVYYVHSFYAETGAETVATSDYINPFSAALVKNNFNAVQFHPEKSGTAGEIILKNFIEL